MAWPDLWPEQQDPSCSCGELVLPQPWLPSARSSSAGGSCAVVHVSAALVGSVSLPGHQILDFFFILFFFKSKNLTVFQSEPVTCPLYPLPSDSLNQDKENWVVWWMSGWKHAFEIEFFKGAWHFYWSGLVWSSRQCLDVRQRIRYRIRRAS